MLITLRNLMRLVQQMQRFGSPKAFDLPVPLAYLVLSLARLPPHIPQRSHHGY